MFHHILVSSSLLTTAVFKALRTTVPEHSRLDRVFQSSEWRRSVPLGKARRILEGALRARFSSAVQSSVIRVTLPVTTKLIDISKFAEPRDEYLSLEISYPERYIISSFLRFNSDVQSVRLG